MNSNDPRLIETTNHSAARDSESRPRTETRPPNDLTPSGTRPDDLLSIKPNIINLLYILSFFTFFTGIAGVALCYVWSNDDVVPAWEKTHLRYHIRTFWLGLLGMIAGTVLLLVLIGFFVWAAVAVWTVVRCVMSFTRASKGEAMPNPETLLW